MIRQGVLRRKRRPSKTRRILCTALCLLDQLDRAAFGCWLNFVAAVCPGISTSYPSERTALVLSGEPVASLPVATSCSSHAAFPGKTIFLKVLTLFPCGDFVFPGATIFVSRSSPVRILSMVRLFLLGLSFPRRPVQADPRRGSPDHNIVVSGKTSLVSLYSYRLFRETNSFRRGAYPAPVGRSGSRCPSPTKYRRPWEIISSPPGKGTPGLSSFPGSFIVFCGKIYWLFRERMASFPGMHIVCLGKIYRLPRESLVIPLGKRKGILPGNLEFLFLMLWSLPVVVVC